MTGQSNAAAERSAHVERGSARPIPGESFLVEVQPGVFQLKAVAEAQREIARLRAALVMAGDALREAGCTFAADAAHAAMLEGSER